MKQVAFVEFCTTHDIIRDYFTKASKGSQFRCLRNIVLDIHEDDILAYNAPGRYFLEEWILKLKKYK